LFPISRGSAVGRVDFYWRGRKKLATTVGSFFFFFNNSRRGLAENRFVRRLLSEYGGNGGPNNIERPAA